MHQRLAILALFVAVLPAPSWAKNSCELALSRPPVLPDRSAELQLPDGSQARALYLLDKPMRDGRMGQIYFLPDSGAFAFFPKAEGAPSTVAMDVPVQVGPTCAVHSAINCLKFLAASGMLPESSLKHLLDTDPAELFRLLHQHVSAESWENDFQALEPGTPSLFVDFSANAWIQRFQRMGHTQADRRARLFEAEGLSVEIVHSIDRLLAHLRAGYPAFVDIPVRPELPPSFVGEPIRATGSGVYRFGPSYAGDPRYFGWHSVLAIAVIDVSGAGERTNPYVLVLDSATGEPRLWRADEIEPALALPYSMTASLVTPAR